MSFKDSLNTILKRSELSENVRKLLMVGAALSFVAMCIAAYLIYLHYVPEASSICQINGQFNCDVVNKSQWSYLNFGGFKLPVAILGTITYFILLVGFVGLVKKFDFRKIYKNLSAKMVVTLMTLFTGMGIGFTMFLTYIEAFVLRTFCIFCVAQQVLIIIIFGVLVACLFKDKEVE